MTRTSLLTQGLFAGLLGCLVIVLPATDAQSYQLTRTAFSSGAVHTSGGSFTLSATLGEAGVVGLVSGGSYILGEGFWSNILIATPAPEVSDASAQWVNALLPNFPNPFGGATSIAYSVAVRSPVKLTVYNVVGRRIATLVDSPIEAGRYRVQWDGRDDSGNAVASGVYFYQLDIGSWSETRKMLKLRF